jgi:hypothetical protein
MLIVVALVLAAVLLVLEEVFPNVGGAAEAAEAAAVVTCITELRSTRDDAPSNNMNNAKAERLTLTTSRDFINVCNVNAI